MDFRQKAQELRDLIIGGKHTDVRIFFESWGKKKWPREFAQEYAEIAWRASDPLTTLKILHPIVFPENNFHAAGNDLEKMTYASALVNLGAADKAIELLSSVDHVKHPVVLLKKSLANFTFWDYQSSVPLLEEYVSLQSDPYLKIVGQLNLAAALIFLAKWSEGRILIDEIISKSEVSGYTLVLGNALELKSQVQISNAEYLDAQVTLAQAGELLRQQDGDFSLYVEKWQIIGACLADPSEEKIQNIKNFKSKAASHLQWESVRECDLYLAVIKNDEILLKKVLAGSPHESYRNRARALFGKHLLPPGSFDWILNETSEMDFYFDPYGTYGECRLFEKPQLLKLFDALTNDFYKANHIALLFSQIYEEEKFNPFTSPSRVLKLLGRLDDWFIAAKVPLRVRFKKSEFALEALQDFRVTVKVTRGKKLAKETGYIQQLKESIQHRSFSSVQAAERLNISRRLAKQIIDQGIDSGKIRQLGSGRSTLYRFGGKKAA